ncbi:hypothetical protein AVEN_210893-1 [Araneus ventricosus]|uniref:Uncharacterized protein n=1 Tax=Araneus ventricosus TaxID=182803 RepID=A0A4Y2LKB8_ARAVE|nr:hypothetical protein AVEN_210893-1 [Araneus ventricosus]
MIRERHEILAYLPSVVSSSIARVCGESGHFPNADGIQLDPSIRHNSPRTKYYRFDLRGTQPNPSFTICIRQWCGTEAEFRIQDQRIAHSRPISTEDDLLCDPWAL